MKAVMVIAKIAWRKPLLTAGQEGRVLEGH
jgi:hypothetical protein